MGKKRAKREAEAKVFELETLAIGPVSYSDSIVSHDVDDLLGLLPGMCNLIDAVLDHAEWNESDDPDLDAAAPARRLLADVWQIARAVRLARQGEVVVFRSRVSAVEGDRRNLALGLTLLLELEPARGTEFTDCAMQVRRLIADRVRGLIRSLDQGDLPGAEASA